MLTTLDAMTVGGLREMVETCDSRLRDLDRLMRTTPADTAAYVAMEEGYRTVANFRCRVDDELVRRGV